MASFNESRYITSIIDTQPLSGGQNGFFGGFIGFEFPLPIGYP